MARRWLTTTQAAEFLGVHPNTIRNWADSGRLPVVRTDGGQRRFDRRVLLGHRLAANAGDVAGGNAADVAAVFGEPGHAGPLIAAAGYERILAALAESAVTASSRGEFHEVCASLSQSAGEALGEASVDFFLTHPAERELEYLGGWQKHALRPDEWAPGERVPADAFRDWRAVFDGSDGVIVDCHSEELSDEERADYQSWDEQSVICVPLRFEGRLIGIMDITTRSRSGMFTEEQLAYAKVVAAHVSTALTNARLVAHERQRSAQMEALLTIAAAVNSTVGLPQALARIAREMGMALAADVASLYTYDQPGDEMLRVARWDSAAPRASRRGVGLRRARADFHASWNAALAAGRPVVAEPADAPEEEAPRTRSPSIPAAEPRDDAGVPAGPVVSWLTVPLYQDGALRGLVDVYSRDPRRVFSEEDVLFAGAVARHVEIALQGSELVASSQRRSERLEEVLDATRAMTALLDPEDVARAAVLNFGRSLGVPEATLYEVSADHRALVVTESYFVDEQRRDEAFVGERLSLKAYPNLARVVSDGTSRALNRLMTEELSPAEVEIMQRFGTRGWLAVPMVEAGRVVGVVEGCDNVRDRWFTSDDVRTAEIYAAQAVSALARARAYRKERERSRDLALLLRAANEISGSLELDEAMSRVCQAVGEAFAYQYVTVYDWDESRRRLRAIVSYRGEHARLDPSFVGSEFGADEEPAMIRVVEGGEPFWSERLDDPRLTASERHGMRLWQTGSWLFVPMVYQGRSVGLLEIDFSEEGRRFSEREVALVQAIANQAAVVMVNARLFERQRKQARDLARTAAVRETLVRFGAGLRLRDTGPGVAQELAGALRDLKLFEGAAVLLHDPRSQEYQVCEAFGTAAAYADCAVADESVEAIAVAQAMGTGREARAEVQRAEQAFAAELADGAKHGDGTPTAGVATAAKGAARAAPRSRRRGIHAPIVDQQGECVGLVVALRGESGAAAGHDVSRAEAASLVRLLCDQAGIAIRAAHRLVELQRNLEQAWTMNEVVTAVGSTLDVSEVLRQAVGGMRRVTEFDTVAFWFVSHDGLQADVTTLGGPGTPARGSALGRTIAVSYNSADPVWRAIDAARTTRIDLADGRTRISGLHCTGSVAVVPLLGQGRVVGAVVVGSEQAGAFSDSDTVFLEQFTAQIGAALQNARLYGRIRNLHLSNLQALSTALNVKDTYMMTHAPRVAAYASLLCRRLGYDEDRIEDVERAAYLHDIGRIGVPDAVLQKPDRLNEREWALVRDHAAASADIIEPIFSEDVYLAVRHHHERWDGKGYPEGRKASELPQLARVLTLVDAYDAMTTGSSHARPRAYGEAVEELRRCAGKQFDPELVPIFIELLGELDELRLSACAAADAAAQALDWNLHATLRSAGGVSREHYPEIEKVLADVTTGHPPVARLFTVVPAERGYVLAAGSSALGIPRPSPGEEVNPPSFVIDAAAGAVAGRPVEASLQPTVLTIDAHGCWMSGYFAIAGARGRIIAIVQADVPVETGVSGGPAGIADAGETLDSILRQTAARMTRIEAAANSDGLTGLFNHRYFQERLEQELARARNQDESLALLFCDLDHFKLYNDTVGHQAGDEALRRMAQVLHQELRRVDIAARYGGEEFAVILPDTGQEGAVEVAERVRRAVEVGREAAAYGLPLTVSIGAAVFPADAADAVELIDRADWAMYRAKRKGRNRVEVFAAGDDRGSGEAGPG